MITREQYVDYFKKQRTKMMKSGYFRSVPTFLFKWDECDEEWVFDPDNWNGCDILRRFLYNEPPVIHGVDIKEYVIDDTTFFFIFTPGDFYEISWYKYRGRTDYIRKNGEPITIDEYLDICNTLNLKLGDTV